MSSLTELWWYRVTAICVHEGVRTITASPLTTLSFYSPIDNWSRNRLSHYRLKHLNLVEIPFPRTRSGNFFSSRYSSPFVPCSLLLSSSIILSLLLLVLVFYLFFFSPFVFFYLFFFFATVTRKAASDDDLARWSFGEARLDRVSQLFIYRQKRKMELLSTINLRCRNFFVVFSRITFTPASGVKYRRDAQDFENSVVHRCASNSLVIVPEGESRNSLAKLHRFSDFPH